MRTPYFNLDGYMERYWLIPFTNDSRNGCYNACFFKNPIVKIFQHFDIAIRVHKILRSDSGRDFHNHPWNFISVILDGSYTEVCPMYNGDIYLGTSMRRYETGDILFRKSNDFHRLLLKKPVWTLFITTRKERVWGFKAGKTNSQFIPAYEYNEKV